MGRSNSWFQEVLKGHWPHPRHAGEGTLYNFGSAQALAVLTWFGHRDGYMCEIVENEDHEDFDRSVWQDAHHEWIGDSWGAHSLEEACMSLEVAMGEIREAEGLAYDEF